jgi:molybdopterin synthase catalytic subunit/molybdopterin converting factor small subunit
VIALKVRLFAGLREAVGREVVEVALDEPARVRDLLARLGADHAVIGKRAGTFAVAVNLAIATPEQSLAHGDEVALLPPVGGGSSDDLIELVSTPIDSNKLLAFVNHPGAGGVTLFLGTARDVHEGRSVVRLEYEAYATMAVQVLTEIARDTRSLFPAVKKLALSHRLGLVPIGEASVAVAVSTPHRDESFRACRHAIDTLKAKAPIWKKEVLAEGDARWIENKESKL